jgi:hypothetical protein
MTPSIPKDIFYSFQNQFEKLLWLWMHLVEDYKISLCLKNNGVNVQRFITLIYLSTLVASQVGTKMQPLSLSHIGCHSFEVCKPFMSRYISSMNKW